jgi:hypothetical protein
VSRLRPDRHATSSFCLSGRDIKILEFLWKWKLAPTATLHAIAGENRSSYGTYQALMRLEILKYVKSQVNARHRFQYWELTKVGFQSIRESLGELKEVGFRSENPFHDLNVLAFQFGNWAAHPGARVKHFTEQELRRLSVDDYPDWIPRLFGRRSDGYTQIESTSGQKRVLAFEVELSAKSVSAYESILTDYRADRKIYRIFWLIGSALVKSQILKAKDKRQFEEDGFFLFVDQAEYFQKGWNAPIFNSRSENLGSMADFMWGIYGERPSISPGFFQAEHDFPIHYDPRKVIRIQAKRSI